MNNTVEFILPVLNEEKIISASVSTIYNFLNTHFEDYNWQITIADNGSTDKTATVSRFLSTKFDRVNYVRIAQRGRGRALKQCWTTSKSDIVAYMDIDLSTQLDDIKPLLDSILQHKYDIAIGSRLIKGSIVEGRSRRREFTSRSYNKIIQLMFSVNFNDAQCGFKAISRSVATQIVPLIKDDGWFFDTELLIVADKCDYRIKEVPVRWSDDPDTRVKVFSTALYDLCGLARLKFGGLRSAKSKLKSNK
jgi:glycosyltransferase involved in cell wall biosynthesis